MKVAGTWLLQTQDRGLCFFPVTFEMILHQYITDFPKVAQNWEENTKVFVSKLGSFSITS